MLQRIGLAQALMNSPELVFLDEPMSGLDPIGRRLVREMILELRAQGSTVVFSTHILSDAETLCDRVALLRGGRLVAVGRIDEILHIDVSHMEVLVSRLSPEKAAALPGDPQRRRAMGERWALQVEERELGAVVRAVEEAGGHILSVQPVRQSLEDFFFKEMASTEGAAWVAD
jgi:ABC-2 type transport system ATP-binding protein